MTSLQNITFLLPFQTNFLSTYWLFCTLCAARRLGGTCAPWAIGLYCGTCVPRRGYSYQTILICFPAVLFSPLFSASPLIHLHHLTLKAGSFRPVVLKSALSFLFSFSLFGKVFPLYIGTTFRVCLYKLPRYCLGFIFQRSQPTIY